MTSVILLVNRTSSKKYIHFISLWHPKYHDIMDGWKHIKEDLTLQLKISVSFVLKYYTLKYTDRLQLTLNRWMDDLKCFPILWKVKVEDQEEYTSCIPSIYNSPTRTILYPRWVLRGNIIPHPDLQFLCETRQMQAFSHYFHKANVLNWDSPFLEYFGWPRNRKHGQSFFTIHSGNFDFKV